MVAAEDVGAFAPGRPGVLAREALGLGVQPRAVSPKQHHVVMVWTDFAKAVHATIILLCNEHPVAVRAVFLHGGPNQEVRTFVCGQFMPLNLRFYRKCPLYVKQFLGPKSYFFGFLRIYVICEQSTAQRSCGKALPGRWGNVKVDRYGEANTDHSRSSAGA